MNKYKYVKEAGYTAADIARMFGYKSANAFRNSSAYHRILKGVDDMLKEQLSA
jgi:hypothetical protein